jgi:hypothetical protein
MKSDDLTPNPIVREADVLFYALRQRGKIVCLISNMPCLAHVIRLSLHISRCPPTSYPGLLPSGLLVSGNLMVLDLVCKVNEITLSSSACDGFLSLQTYVRPGTFVLKQDY